MTRGPKAIFFHNKKVRLPIKSKYVGQKLAKSITIRKQKEMKRKKERALESFRRKACLSTKKMGGP